MMSNLIKHTEKIQKLMKQYTRRLSIQLNSTNNYNQYFSDIKLKNDKIFIHFASYKLKNRDYKRVKNVIRKKYDILNDIKIEKNLKRETYAYNYKAIILFNDDIEKNRFIMEQL